MSLKRCCSTVFFDGSSDPAVLSLERGCSTVNVLFNGFETTCALLSIRRRGRINGRKGTTGGAIIVELIEELELEAIINGLVWFVRSRRKNLLLFFFIVYAQRRPSREKSHVFLILHGLA